MTIAKENVSFVETPLGNIELFFDGKRIPFHSAIWYTQGELVIGAQYTSPPAVRMFYSYQADAKKHSLLLKLNTNLVGDVATGEKFEALTFEKNDFSMTVGCFAAFGEDILDYDGFYNQNGIQIEIDPRTSSQVCCFGTSWIVPIDDYDVRAWLSADPFDDWKKYHLCCP